MRVEETVFFLTLRGQAHAGSIRFVKDVLQQSYVASLSPSQRRGGLAGGASERSAVDDEVVTLPPAPEAAFESSVVVDAPANCNRPRDTVDDKYAQSQALLLTSALEEAQVALKAGMYERTQALVNAHAAIGIATQPASAKREFLKALLWIL